MSTEAMLKFATVSGAAAALCVWYALTLRRRIEALQRQLDQQATRRDELAMELMSTRNKFMHSPESVVAGRTFKPAPSDVFVVTYPKCGTTWMMQIVHALRTRADMNYGEITEVVPWDILAHDCGQALDGEQVALPRAFKSHEAWADVSKGGRYIYVARNPLDAFVSFHKFLPAYIGLGASDISYEAFAKAIFAGASLSGQIWSHYAGWWEQRHHPNVLWIFFEDMKDDLRGTIARVAEFLQIAADSALLDKVAEVSSFAFMSSEQHAHHFDDHFVRAHVLPKMGLAPDTKTAISKVRKGGGRVGERKSIPMDVIALLEARWEQHMVPATGCSSYDELRAAYRKEVRHQ
mmetsp:Transcript_59959/g.137468  ORF Transcript_59959/g.137468 Transcript_59959/m.137468 type:complete len:349 (-) Transcript_59959:513-1559(-)|eukprot:CAMPEP_0119352730 /NCGR_PEP_ID=MMETSP1334-20130426/1977_1 /TAXON_ID=127549 /ORGANISM="Calcidiscus leptoporus, Strain RCC1130" /LENGTH=348 /DNA_ID=CAMNT_0007365837 /DNA_START=119 /DNA_END=1165 /DNA_ORIENTATION=+